MTEGRHRRSARRLALCGVLLCLAGATEAAARETSRHLPVELEVDSCTGVAADVVNRVLTVELGVAVTTGPGEPADATPKPDTTQVLLSCDEGTIKMVVRDPLSGKTLERHVDLRSERASARSRLLGLSAAELVAASWIELDAAPPPPVPIVEATAPAPARPEAADLARAALKRQEPVLWDVEMIALARHFPDAGLTTWGGGIAGTWAYQGWLALGGDIVGETGTADLSHDGAKVGSATARTGSVGVAARLRRGWATVGLEAGIGARLGLTRAHASADPSEAGLWQEHAFTGTWGGPLVQVRMGWKPSPLFVLAALVEAGTVTRQLAGSVAGQPELLVTGSWVGLSLGVGLGTDSRALGR